MARGSQVGSINVTFTANNDKLKKVAEDTKKVTNKTSKAIEKSLKGVAKTSTKTTDTQISNAKKFQAGREKQLKKQERAAQREIALQKSLAAAEKARHLASRRVQRTGRRRSAGEHLRGGGGRGGGGDGRDFYGNPDPKSLATAAPTGFAVKRLGAAALGISATMGAIKVATAAGVAAFAGFGIAIKAAGAAAIDFQASFQEVRAITSGTAKGFDTLSKSVKRISSETGITNKELVNASVVLGRAGFRAGEVGEALETVSDLATASGMTVANAANISVRMLKSFGKELKELPHVADMLATASANANVSIQSLGEGFKFAGAISETVGLSFSEVTTSLSLLGETGLEAGLAGRALQAMIMDLANPTDRARKKLFDMGVVTHDAQGKMLPLKSILGQLSDANMDASDSFQIFNRNSARAVTALTRNVEKFKEFEDTIKNGTGAIKDQADTIRDSVTVQFKAFKESLNSLGIELGDVFLPHLKNLAEGLKDIVKEFGKIARMREGESLIGDGQMIPKRKGLGSFKMIGPQGNTVANVGAAPSKNIKELEAAAREAQKKMIQLLLSPEKLLSGYEAGGIGAGSKEFIGSIERFNHEFGAVQVSGAEEVAKKNLPGMVRSMFMNIYSELARTGLASTKQAVDAALAGQKAMMETDEYKAAVAEQNRLLKFFTELKQAGKLDKGMIKDAFKSIQKNLDDEAKQLLAFGDEAEKVSQFVEEGLDSEGLAGTIGRGLKAWFDKNLSGMKLGVTTKKDPEGPMGGTVIIEAGQSLADTFVTAFGYIEGTMNQVASMFESVSGELGSVFMGMVQGLGDAFSVGIDHMSEGGSGFMAIAKGGGASLNVMGSAMMAVLQKSEAFGNFMEKAGEIFGVLANALNPFVEVISSVMVPVLKVVARILLAAFTVLAVIWNAIAGFLNLFGANIQTIDIGDMWSSFEDGMDNLGNSVDDTTNKFDDLNSSLTGIAGLPDAIKLNLIAFREAMNSTRAILTGRTSASPGHMSGPIRMHTGGVVPGAGNQDSVLALLTPGEQVIPAGQSAGDGTNVQIGTMIVKVTDVKDFVKKLNNQQEWRSMARSGSLYGKGVVGSR